MEIDADIARIERALNRVDETDPDMLPWVYASAALEIALQIAKLRKDLDAITNCVGGGRFDVQCHGVNT